MTEKNKRMNRIDFVLLVDVQDGNPNGDPARGNHPREDAYTGEGLISDACLKRKIRDYVARKYAGEPGMEIYQNRDDKLLSELHRECGAPSKSEDDKEKSKDKEKTKAPKINRAEQKAKALAALCERFWDVRVFGALAVGDYEAGAARGAVQITFGRSLHPIQVTAHQITRIATTNAKDKKENGAGVFNATKHLVRYAIYRFQGTIMPYQAQRTGVSERDVQILIEAMTACWGEDVSAARGIMTPRELFLARHETPDGTAPMGRVFDAVRVQLAREIPASYADVQVQTDPVPGVTITRT